MLDIAPSLEKPQKKVTFDNVVLTVLIPTFKEFHTAGLAELLWWNDQDYYGFKASAIEDVKQHMKSLNGLILDGKAALKSYMQSFFEPEDIQNTQENKLAAKSVPQPAQAPTQSTACSPEHQQFPRSVVPQYSQWQSSVFYDPCYSQGPLEEDKAQSKMKLPSHLKPAPIKTSKLDVHSSFPSYSPSYLNKEEELMATSVPDNAGQNSIPQEKEGGEEESSGAVRGFMRMLVFGVLVILNKHHSDSSHPSPV